MMDTHLEGQAAESGQWVVTGVQQLPPAKPFDSEFDEYWRSRGFDVTDLVLLEGDRPVQPTVIFGKPYVWVTTAARRTALRNVMRVA